MSIPLFLGPTIPPFSQYFQEQSSMAAAAATMRSMPEPYVVQEEQKLDAGEKHRLRDLVARVYLDGIYVLFERERREEVDVPEAAHLRSVQQRADAEKYREEQAEKAAKAASKAQFATEEAERHRLRAGSNASSFSLRRIPSSLNRLCSRIRSGQKGLDRVEEQPSRGPSLANLQALAAAAGGAQDHHGVHNTPTFSPSAAVAIAAVAGPSRSPSSGSPKAIGTRAITHRRNDSGHHESCQSGTDIDEGRMGLVVRKKVSMASSRSKYSQPESAEIVGRGNGEVDEDRIEVIGTV
ncbi:MAG: hypothetical protein Q9212_003099 [Teloschistes hypoglaucus]